jgi:hypothetical protein
MNDDQTFWIVGATLHGNDSSKVFLDRGYWQLGTNSKPKRDILYMERFNKIKSGDRIAIKSLSGKGSGTMKIKAIGIIKDVVSVERRVYVKWVVMDVERKVDWNGCMDAVNGPYKIDQEHRDWINGIFRI